MKIIESLQNKEKPRENSQKIQIFGVKKTCNLSKKLL